MTWKNWDGLIGTAHHSQEELTTIIVMNGMIDQDSRKAFAKFIVIMMVAVQKRLRKNNVHVIRVMKVPVPGLKYCLSVLQ